MCGGGESLSNSRLQGNLREVQGRLRAVDQRIFPSLLAKLFCGQERVFGEFSLQIFQNSLRTCAKKDGRFFALWDLMGFVSKSMVVNLAGHKCCWCDEIGRLLHGR